MLKLYDFPTGENINITWSRDGNTIAVGNKEDLITFIDTKTNKIRAEEKFNFEINEIMWNKTSDQMFLTSGQGSIHVLNYPNLEVLTVLKAHPATCICIDFDQSGKYFAVGSADALTSIWDSEELTCLRVLSRLDWVTHKLMKLKLNPYKIIFSSRFAQSRLVTTAECWLPPQKIILSTFPA